MTEALIKDSLIRLSTATQPSSGDCDATEQSETIARELDTLDQLFASERRSLHPQLAHFLQHRSYAKALAFLGGAEGEIPAASRRKINEANA